MTDHCGDIQREHVDRIVNIEGRMARLEERVTTIESQTEYNTKGVNNFNSFRIDASGKLKFIHGAAWAWSLILASLFAIAGWALSNYVIPAAKALMQDYYERHPNAQVLPPHHNKSDAITTDPAYALRQNPPQEAAIRY